MDGRDPKQHEREEKVRIARLMKAKKSIDNELPKGLRRGKGGKVSRKRDAKKEMKVKAMQEYMKKENQILKRRVADMVKADKKKRSAHIKFRSVNAVVQEKERKRIKNDNDILKRNLANSTAFYDVAAIERDTARMKKQWKRNPFTILRENNAKRLVKENKINRERLKKNGKAFYNVKEWEADVKRMKGKLLHSEPAWKVRQREIKRENKINAQRFKKNAAAYYNPAEWEADVARMKAKIIKGVPTWKVREDKLRQENNMFYKRLEKTKPLVGSREEWQKQRQRIEERIIWTCSLRSGRLGRNVAPLLGKKSPALNSSRKTPTKMNSPRRPQTINNRSRTPRGTFRRRQYQQLGVTPKRPQRPASAGKKKHRKNFMLLGYL